MTNGFLDDLPDLNLPGRRRKKKPPEPADQVVRYIRLRCPNSECRSTNCPVYNSDHLPTRYHKCADCGLNFKSVEENY